MAQELQQGGDPAAGVGGDGVRREALSPRRWFGQLDHGTAQQSRGERHQVDGLVRFHPGHPVRGALDLVAQLATDQFDVVDDPVGVLEEHRPREAGHVGRHGVQGAHPYGQTGLLGEFTNDRVSGVLALLHAAAGKSPETGELREYGVVRQQHPAFGVMEQAVRSDSSDPHRA